MAKSSSVASKLRDTLQKRGVNTNFNQITQWTGFGNMALNYIVTGRLRKGIPNKRTGAIAGPSGTGKSLLFAKIIKNVQDLGYFIIYVDSESAIDENFLTRHGISLDEEKFMPISLSTIEDLTEVMADVFNVYDAEDKVAVFIDSMSNLETEKEAEAFQKGELANDMGLLAKKIKQFVKNMNNKVGQRDMFMIYNLHTYANQDVTNGKGKNVVSGGEAQIYIPSWCLMLDKLNLKEGAEQVGIKMKATTKKTRYNQLGLKTEIYVPWKTGIDEHYGVIEILVKHGILDQKGAWYSYTDDEGKEVKFQSKKFKEHVDYLVDKFESQVDDDVIENADSTEAPAEESEE